jgi:Fic family protein
MLIFRDDDIVPHLSCTQIKGVQMNVRRISGTALASDVTGEVIYTPPVGEDILRKLLANWERFLHNEVAIDPLIRTLSV